MVHIDNENLMEITPDIDVNANMTSSIIKVMGVGGGGSNAAKHMYNMGITDVDFMICNTDKQSLISNPIPIKIQLGESGLGAGAMPEVARQAALESEEKIKAALSGTRMLFVTAGMGGGTGTGASPIIASIARDLGILTVGIVTYPFNFEQKDKFDLANEGIYELSQNVDALIVIKNEALKSFYPDLKLSNAFAKVDDVLLIAAKSIAELITLESIMNVDFNDVKTVLENSGTALIGSGEAQGEDRALQAVEAAINSPLLDQNSIYGAEKLLFFISYSEENELAVNELERITEELENKTCTECKKLIWGHGIDNSLGDKVRVTVIATGLHNNKNDYTKRTYTVKENKENIVSKPVTAVEDKSVNRNETDNFQSVIIPLGAIPDNNELREKTDKEMDEYFKRPAIDRKQEMKNFTTNTKDEISEYKASSTYGLECNTASYLKDVVD